MTEFQELMIKQNVYIACMLNCINKQNITTMIMLGGNNIEDYAYKTDNSFMESYENLMNAIKEYNEKVGG